MRVLFYQPAHEGHHFAYLSRMLPGFVGLPIEILVATTPRAAASTEFEKSLAQFGERIQLVACCTPSPRKPLANARHRLRELQEAIRLTQPDHVAVCYADGIWDVAYVAAALGKRPWSDELAVEGWIYRGRFADADDTRLKSRLRRRMFTGLLRKGLFCKLHLHHELLYEFASEASRGQPTSVCLAPDPIVIRDPLTPAEARRELGIAGGATAPEKWIGVAGVIARFKGAHLLLDAYRQLRQSAKQPVKLLLAGPSDEHVRTLLSESPYREAVAAGDIVCLDRFLTENEMFAAAAAVDLVVAPYPHHQNRSSIILWAAAAGRPCLSTEDSCVGYVIHKERLGATCNVRDTAAMAGAINTLLAKPWTADDAARVRSYAAFHRMENYQAISSKLVRERLATSGALAAPAGDSVKATA